MSRGNKRAQGFCRLCLSHGPLCNSHILPEYLYRHFYDEQRRALVVTLDRPQSPKFQQSGFKEFMLCPSCEGLINEYEKVFKSEWIDSGVMRSVTNGNQILEFKDLNLHRLFHLSVLFRASCSSHGIFSEVQLDSVNHERIRKLLLESRSPSESDYPVVCASLLLEGAPSDQFIGPPHFIWFGRWRVYYFTFAACQWLYFGPSVELPDTLRGQLKNSKPIHIIQREWMAFEHYKKMFHLSKKQERIE